MTPEVTKLIENNVALAISIAVKVSKRCRSVDLDELCSEARLQLCRAALSYDPTRGVAFSTYAYRCIESKLLTFCQNQIRNPIDPWSSDSYHDPWSSDSYHDLPETSSLSKPSFVGSITYDYEAILDIEAASAATNSRAGIKRKIKGGVNA